MFNKSKDYSGLIVRKQERLVRLSPAKRSRCFPGTIAHSFSQTRKAVRMRHLASRAEHLPVVGAIGFNLRRPRVMHGDVVALRRPLRAAHCNGCGRVTMLT